MKYSTYIYTWPDSQECEGCKKGIAFTNEHSTFKEGALCDAGHDKDLSLACPAFVERKTED